jgi:hypothetical protein
MYWTLIIRLTVTTSTRITHVTHFLTTDERGALPPQVRMSWLNEARRSNADIHRVATTQVGIDWFGWVLADERGLD